MLIHEIGAGGYWTGESIEIAEDAGCPQGWTRAPLPDLAAGEYALFEAPVWIVTETPYAPPAPLAPPVPISVTPRQAQLALHAAGLLDDVEAAVDAADRPIQIAWRAATEYRRDDPVVAALGSAIGLSAAQVDDLFRVAATL